MQYKRISADCHLDMPWMPPDLFTSMAPREMKDRMPFVVETDDGPKWTAKNGASFGYKNGVGPAGSKYVPGKHHRVDVMAETGLYSDGAKDIRRVSDPHLRIKDLDRDGVDAEVIYGILGASSRLNDKDASNEMLRIYNDWLKGFCSHYPDRHIGLACLPYGDIDAAVQETYRVAKLGLRGLELSCSWDMEPMWHPDVGAAVEGGERRAAAAALPHLPDPAAQHHREARRPGRTLGVLHRRLGLPDEPGEHPGRHHRRQRAGALPNIRIAFGESGCGWIPYALDRMDFEWEDRFTDLGLKMKPSDYWRRQCKATFQFDRIGAKLIDDMGAESLMWGSDYPHGDGVWPHSDKYIKEQFAEVSPEVTKMITCTNAGKFYGLIN